jgi:hypothetical protein
VCQNGKVKRVKATGVLKQRLIVTFSRKMMEYQRAVRNRQIERAKKLLATNDPEEIKKGQQRSFYPYKNVSENLKVLPYFHYGEALISLCISCDTRYVEGSIISPKLKIIGLYLETPWYRGVSPEFHEFSNSIVK